MFSFFGKFIDWIKNRFFNKELEIAIVGLQNAGKTTLVKAITDGTFEEDTIPTIGFNRHEIKKGTDCSYDRKNINEALGFGRANSIQIIMGKVLSRFRCHYFCSRFL